MKYKIKHEKSNLVFMSSILVLCLVTCVLWLVLREYINFFIFLILTLSIAHVYYFTYYYINKDALIVKLGFIKIKIKYNNFINVENMKNSIKLKFKKVSINIYPNNKDIFYADILDKMKGI